MQERPDLEIDITAPRTRVTGKRAFLKDHASTILGQGATLGIGTLTGILSARMLGPVGRGEYAAVTVWPMGIAMLCWLGISQAIAFNVGRKAFTISEIATAAATIGLFQSLLSILLGLLVVPFVLAKYSVGLQHLGITFVLFTPALILLVYPSNLFQGLPDLGRFNLIRVIAPLTFLIGLVGAYCLNRRTLSLVIFSQLLGYLVALGVGCAMVRRILKPTFQWNKLAISRLLHFGVRTQATTLTSYFNQRIDQLMLSLFVKPEELGYYAVAVTLSVAITFVPQAAGIVTFSRGSGQHREGAVVTIGNSFRASLAWLLVCCAALYVFAPFLIRLVFGPAFEGSILACRILVPGTLMLGLNQVLYNGASALGRPGLPAIAEGVGVGITAVGLYVLVPHFGYIGAAIVSSVAYTVSFLLMLILAKSFLGMSLRALFMAAH